MGAGSLHPIDRVMGEGIFLAQISKQRGERRELAPDARLREPSSFQVFAPGDQMRTGHRSKVLWLVETRKGGEVFHIIAVGAAGLGVWEIGKPLQFRRYPAQRCEVRRLEGFSVREEGFGGCSLGVFFHENSLAALDPVDP